MLRIRWYGSVLIILLSVPAHTAARTSASVFFGLQTTGELGVAFGVGRGVIGVGLCVGRVVRGGTAGVAGGWTGGNTIVARVDRLGGFLPGGLLGVDVYIEPSFLLIHIVHFWGLGRICKCEPFFVFGVPYCFVSFRNLRRWRAGRRGKFIHLDVILRYEFSVVRTFSYCEERKVVLFRGEIMNKK